MIVMMMAMTPSLYAASRSFPMSRCRVRAALGPRPVRPRARRVHRRTAIGAADDGRQPQRRRILSGNARSRCADKRHRFGAIAESQAHENGDKPISIVYINNPMFGGFFRL